MSPVFTTLVVLITPDAAIMDRSRGSQELAIATAARHVATTRSKNMAQDLALTEAAEPAHGERRMVRELVVEIELAESAVSKVPREFLAQPPLMTNAITVTDQEHPDHQLRIDRGPADVAIKCFQLFVQVGQNGGREH
jgi:hypothetical protein